MLHRKDIGKCFWTEALGVAIQVEYMVPSSSIPASVMLHELLYGTKSNLSYLRFSGSECWYKSAGVSLSKLDNRGKEDIMIGSARRFCGHKLWDLVGIL